MSRKETTSRDVWCDHCDDRFTAEIAGKEGVGTCPNCGKPTLLVMCRACENQSELTYVNFQSGNWICPQCKEYREISAATITDFLAAQIAIESVEVKRAEDVRHRLSFSSFATGCVVVIFLYFGFIIFVSSCANRQRTRLNSNSVRTESRSAAIARETRIAQSLTAEAIRTEDIFLEWDRMPLNSTTHYGMLAYVSEVEGETFVKTSPPRSQYKPVECTGEISALRWEADSDGLFYACVAAEETNLFFVTRNGTVRDRMLIKSPVDKVALAPHRRMIVYTLKGERGLFQRDRTTVEGVSLLLDVVANEVTWSPHGDQLAFVGGENRLNNLYLYTIGEQEQRRATYRAYQPEREPAWSPHGEHIIFVANYTGHWNLYRYEVLSGEIIQLTNFRSTNVRTPTWTPDGRYVTFSADFDGDYDLYVIDPFKDNATPVRLFDTDDADELYPAWEQ